MWGRRGEERRGGRKGRGGTGGKKTNKKKIKQGRGKGGKRQRKKKKKKRNKRSHKKGKFGETTKKHETKTKPEQEAEQVEENKRERRWWLGANFCVSMGKHSFVRDSNTKSIQPLFDSMHKQGSLRTKTAQIVVSQKGKFLSWRPSKEGFVLLSQCVVACLFFGYVGGGGKRAGEQAGQAGKWELVAQSLTLWAGHWCFASVTNFLVCCSGFVLFLSLSLF